MAYCDIIADHRGAVVFAMDHSVVLDIGAFAYNNGRNVTTQNAAIPDARVVVEGDVTNKDSSGGDEAVMSDDGRYAIIRVDRHCGGTP
jgi:hypothetical protein